MLHVRRSSGKGYDRLQVDLGLGDHSRDAGVDLVALSLAAGAHRASGKKSSFVGQVIDLTVGKSDAKRATVAMEAMFEGDRSLALLLALDWIGHPWFVNLPFPPKDSLPPGTQHVYSGGPMDRQVSEQSVRSFRRTDRGEPRGPEDTGVRRYMAPLSGYFTPSASLMHASGLSPVSVHRHASAHIFDRWSSPVKLDLGEEYDGSQEVLP